MSAPAGSETPPSRVGHGRAHPPDPDLVAERIARLTTDARVTRRGYLRILGILSGGLALGNVAVAAGAFRRRTQGATAEVVIVEDASAIPIGGSVRFTYPTERDPAVLLRLDDAVYVAYSTVCTHLACEVLWLADDADLFCPCHDGHFSPGTGEPTAGPPVRPLPGIVLEERDGAILAVGEVPMGEGERQRAGGWGSRQGEGERQRAGGWGSRQGEGERQRAGGRGSHQEAADAS